MKTNTWLLSAAFLSIAAIASATEQAPDVVMYKNSKCELATHWSYPSPLEALFINSGEPSPFRALSTGNYRGHVATWELKDDAMYLKEVMIGETKVDLKRLSDVDGPGGPVKAWWFSGVLLVKTAPRKKWHDNPAGGRKYYAIEYDKFCFIEVREGSIKSEYAMDPEKYWIFAREHEKNPDALESIGHESIRKYFSYIGGAREADDAKRKPQPPERMARLREWIGYVGSIRAEREDKIKRQREKEEKQKKEKCESIYSGLGGYDKARELVNIRDAIIGDINGLPYSMLLEMDMKDEGRLVNSVWWFNPVQGDKAVYDWKDFITAYERVSAVVSRHAWLREWVAGGPDREIEAEIFGITPHTETNMADFAEAPWKHAGLKGSPVIEIHLRRGSQWCGAVFFSEADSRALIISASMEGRSISEPDSYDEASVREDMMKVGGHWLDKFSFRFHPSQETPNYIVVTEGGAWSANKSGK